MAINAAITVTSSVVVTTTTATATDQPGRTDALAKSLQAGSDIGPGIGSAEQSRAYLRQMSAVHDAVAAAAGRMTFTSSAAARDFTASTEKGLLAALHKGDRPGLTALLQDLPTEALAAASKSLANSEARDAESDRLLKALADFITDLKSWRRASADTAPAGRISPFDKTSFVI